MKKSLLIVTLLAFVTLWSCAEKTGDIPPYVEQPADNPDDPTDTEPVYMFSDEFDTEIDPVKWENCSWNSPAWQDFMGEFKFPGQRVERGFIPVEQGCVLLQAVDPLLHGSPEPKDHPWCMGLWTKGIFGFAHGEIEVRAKFVGGQAAWPAIWLMPVDESAVSWPGGGEIDIMERWDDDGEIVQSLHFNGNSGATYETHTVFEGESDLNLGDFNVYGMRKTPGKIEYKINGKVTFTVTREQVVAAGGQWPYEDHEYYVIINMACSPLSTHWNAGAYRNPLPSMDDLPYEMAVDYVRVKAIQ